MVLRRFLRPGLPPGDTWPCSTIQSTVSGDDVSAAQLRQTSTTASTASTHGYICIRITQLVWQTQFKQHVCTPSQTTAVESRAQNQPPAQCGLLQGDASSGCALKLTGAAGGGPTASLTRMGAIDGLSLRSAAPEDVVLLPPKRERGPDPSPPNSLSSCAWSTCKAVISNCYQQDT